MKLFYVSDNFGNSRIMEESTPRKACIRFLEDVHCLNPSSIAKSYHDGKDGKTYHTGYVYGQTWLSVGEYIPMRVAQ